MTDLIPNLDDLRAKLPAGASASDAYEFVSELENAGTPSQVNANVDALVDRWLEVPDDSK